jgi:putative transcriptional regulator
MKTAAFAELLASVNEALEHAKGQRSLKTTVLPRVVEPMDGEDVRSVRASLRASQGVLAFYLNVSTKLVQAWEAGRRQPDGPALVLLRMIEQQPGLVDAFYTRPAPRRRSRAMANGSNGMRRMAAGRR